MADNLNSPSFEFSIENTMEMGMGNSELLSDLFEPETSTSSPDGLERIVKEGSDDFVTGIASSRKSELVDDVISRLSEHGDEYAERLMELNNEFEVTKMKRIERPRSMDDIEIPKGVRIRSTSFGD